MAPTLRALRNAASVVERGVSNCASQTSPARGDRRGLLGADERRHVELVLRGQRGFDKARVDHAHAQAFRLQVQVQGFGKVDQRRFGGPVGQAQRQAPESCHATDQTDVSTAPSQHVGQDGGQNAQGAHRVHLMVLDKC